MADERIALTLRSLREPVTPDADFAERLFEQLSAQIDFKTGTVRRPGALDRARTGWRQWRQREVFVWLVTAAALLAALLLTLALIGRQLQRPADLVDRSKQLYREMPPFEMTVDMPSFRGLVTAYSYDGEGLLRADIKQSLDPGRPVGSHFIFDGHTIYLFDAAGTLVSAESMLGVPGGRPSHAILRYSSVAPADRSSVLALFPMTWDEPHQFASPEPETTCDTVESLGVEEVMGRPSEHIACDYLPGAPHAILEYWIDSATGIILRYHAESDAFEATDFRLEPAFAPDTFAVPRGPGGELPINLGRMEPGSYFTPLFTPTIVLRLGSGWYDANDGTSGGGISSTGGRPYEEADDGNGNAALTPDGFDLIFENVGRRRLVDPATGLGTDFTGSPADFVAWLRSHPTLRLGPSQDVEVPGARGEMFDVTVAGSAGLVPCERFPTAQCLFLMELPGVGHLQFAADSTSRFVVFDVHGQTVLVFSTGNLENGGRAILDTFAFPG